MLSWLVPSIHRHFANRLRILPATLRSTVHNSSYPYRFSPPREKKKQNNVPPSVRRPRRLALSPLTLTRLSHRPPNINLLLPPFFHILPVFYIHAIFHTTMPSAPPSPTSPHASPPAASHSSSLTTDSPQSLLRRSIFLSNRGRHDAAFAAISSAVSLMESVDDNDLTPYLVQLGSVHLAQSRPVQAEDALRRALDLSPHSIPALTGLAAVVQAGDAIRLPECLDLLRRATKLSATNISTDSNFDNSLNDPASTLAAILTDVGVRLKFAGLPASAIEHYNEALTVCSANPHALYNLAVACADSGDTTKARQCYEKCLKVNSSHVEAWCNLGVLNRNDGNTDLAIHAYERALSCNPNFDLAKGNLAVALCEKATVIKESDPKTAKKLYKRALALQPTFADAHYNLGVLYAENSKLEQALVSYNLAVHFNPNLTEALNNIGVVYKDLGNLEMALEHYKRALQCNKQHHQTHNNIAVVYTLLGHVDVAAEHLRLANMLSPEYAEAHNNIGVLLRDQGDIDMAIWHYERCYQLDPRADMAAQNRLHALSYSEKWTKAQVFEQHKNWGINFQQRIDKEIEEATSGSQTDNPIAQHLLQCKKNPPIPDPKTPRGPNTSHPLRVGYVSPDFFTHSVSYFAEVLLNMQGRDGFEIFTYANVAHPDAKTERFQYIVGNRWRNIWGMTASAAAKLIVADKIDILVDLAGHTANNRLDIMALRLAPIQVTWIGYPNTTGLSSVHYRVTDGKVDPVDTAQQFTERLWRLPDAFLCYTPAHDAPEDVGEAPLTNSGGIVTFGSFNVLAKTQQKTIRLWAEILRRVPSSRLLLKAKPFGASAAKKRMMELFEQEGIPGDRLDLVPLIASTRSHLQAYANVDIGLDPFPYAGTTTTCEAMYMGVPVVTLGTSAANGDHAHNVGVSLLSAVGLGDLVAMSDEEYVNKAVRLAEDVNRLTRIRAHLRRDMMHGALGDAQRYMCNVEEMFCGMWSERGGVVSGLGRKKTSATRKTHDGREDGTDDMGDDETTSATREEEDEEEEEEEEENDDVDDDEDEGDVGDVDDVDDVENVDKRGTRENQGECKMSDERCAEDAQTEQNVLATTGTVPTGTGVNGSAGAGTVTGTMPGMGLRNGGLDNRAA